MQQPDRMYKKALSYRWLVWGILIFSYLIVHFHRQSMGVVRDELVGEFGLSASAFANIGSMYFYVYMLMQIPAGILADSLGPRKTVTFGTLLSGCGSILFSIAPGAIWLYIGRLLVGLGVSVIFISILKILACWFRDSEFATMQGLTTFFGNLGGVFAQTPLALMIAAFTWRMSFAMIGAVSLIVSLFCYLLVRNTPQEMGLPLLNQSDKSQEKNSLPEILHGLSVVIKNPGTWVAFIICGGYHGALTSLGSVWGVPYLFDVYNFSKVTAANNITIFIMGVAFGAIFIGKVSDKIGKRKLPMLISGIINVTCWFILVVVFSCKPPVALLKPLLFLLGFTINAAMLSLPYGKEINPPKISGISTSMVNVGGFVGGGLLPPVMGLIMDSYEGVLPAVLLYQKAFLCCLAFSLLALTFTLLVRETNCRNIYKSGP